MWLWGLVVIAAIYSTLGAAQVLVSFLRERNLLRVSFILIVLLVAAAVIWRWIKKPPGWREISVWIGAAAVYAIAFVRVETPEERTHLIEYSLVAILIYQALVERKRNGRQVPFPALLAFTATVILGLLDESIQWILPNRVFDWVDVGFNTLAALMAIGVSLALVYVRRLKLPTLNK